MTLRLPLNTGIQDQEEGQQLNLPDFKYARTPALFALYERLAQQRLVYDGHNRCWLCACVPALESILADVRFSSHRPGNVGTPPFCKETLRGEQQVPGQNLREMKASIEQILGQQLLVKDGPAHMRLQAVMNPALRNMGHHMGTFIEHQAETLLDRVRPAGQWDAVYDLALPLVLGSMVQLLLGERELSPDRLQQFKAWSDALAAVTSGLFSRDSIQQVLAMHASFQRLLAHKRRTQGTDLLSVFATDPRWQDDDELVANAMMLLAAGSVTTTKALVHSLWFLLQHAHRWEYLRTALLQCVDVRTQTQFLKPVIEALLCRVTPTRYIVRWARQDVVIEGKFIQAGQQVYLFLEGANHSLMPQDRPSGDVVAAISHEQWPLLPPVSASQHFTFGSPRSPHYCPGAPLARMLLQCVLLAVLLRFPALRLAPVPVQPWGKNANLGGLLTLPVIHA